MRTKSEISTLPRPELLIRCTALVLLVCTGVPVLAQSSQREAAGGRAATATQSSDWRKTIREFSQEHFKQPAWGYSHCMRDYALARQLAQTDHAKVDDDVLFAAAFLHDMAGFPPWQKQGVDHADQGALVVDTVLQGTGFPMEKIDGVRAAIRGHNYDRTPVGPEALYLHDADALDWLGAIGVARIIALVDPNGGKPDGPKAVAILEDNLAHVPEHVLSAAGRALMPERRAELEQFLKNLRRETDDLRTL
ncbi:MAG TPA: HD domain-containing protein [Steroidobacteraceae bacterium]